VKQTNVWLGSGPPHDALGDDLHSARRGETISLGAMKSCSPIG
jgi:hypothetical protein